jgi:PAS domain S-box-containing protein
VLERHYKEMIDNAVCGIALVTAEGRFSYANKKFCADVEFSQVELYGMTFQEITHPSDVAFDEDMARMVASGIQDDYSMVKRYLTKSQRVLWVRLVVRALKEEGAFEVFFAQILAIHDPAVTEVLNKVRDELSASKAMNERLMERLEMEQATREEARARRERLLDWLGKNWKLLVVVVLAISGVLGRDQVLALLGLGG